MTAVRPDTVYFFGTCLIDLMYPQAGVAAIKLLQQAGVRVIFPQGQTCCGQPPWNSGYRDEARVVGRAQLKLFPKDIPVIVPSGSCAGMFKQHYPELFAGQPEEAQAQALAKRTYEWTEFMVDVLGVELEDQGDALQVAVHTSCSARREMGVAKQIEQLLGQLRQVTVVEQAYKAECCGFGGTFAVKEPEVSASMVADKTAAIRATEASHLVSQDCGCLMNIGGAFDYQAKQENLAQPRVQHIAEFLWERTQSNATEEAAS